MKAELAEADRRAGAAERRLEKLEEQERRRDCWFLQAKRDAGYDQNVSFDIVWDALLAKWLK